MEIKNIIKKLNKNGITNYEIAPIQVGCVVVYVPYKTVYDLSNIRELFKRGVKIEIDYCTNKVTLWNIKEWNRARKIYDDMEFLMHLFYANLSKEKTYDEAKQIQYEYAKENNMLPAFYTIYK